VPKTGVKLRRRLLRAFQRGLYWSGASAIYLRLRPVRGAVILMYHSVTSRDIEPWIDPSNAIPAARFRDQMRFLARARRVISMTELVAGLEHGSSFAPGTVVITFDDGYLDNLEVAAPILAEVELPATLYLATDYVSRGAPQWIDEIYTAFRHRSRDALLLSDGKSRFDLSDPTARRRAYDELCGRLLAAPFDERRELLDSVAGQLAPRGTAPRRTLSWREAARLIDDFPGFEIGVHTRDHVDLVALDPSEAEAQILGCIRDAERELQREIRHFSYPYGRSNEAVRERVAKSGVVSAVVTEPGRPIVAGSDLFALPRFGMSPDSTFLRLASSGAHPGLSLALTRRA
jgi:peptidoglycan/xylan/chitin deacetylase (PgdA/CDA1 family)